MAIFQVVLLGLLGALVCGLTGYAVGRRFGFARREALAVSANAVRMRQQLLVSGVCPICDCIQADMVQYGNKG